MSSSYIISTLRQAVEVLSQDEVRGNQGKLITQLHAAIDMMTRQPPDLSADVRAFHVKFGLLASARPTHLTQRKLIERVECLREELGEFIEACGLEEVPGMTAGSRIIIDRGLTADQDFAGQADALVDLTYFAVGTAVMMGLPWQQLWDDVQRANLAKERGTTQRGHRVDVMKPPGWVGPRTLAVLEAAGYNEDHDARPEHHLDDPKEVAK